MPSVGISMIKKWGLSPFPINYDQDFAIIGDGESKTEYFYNPSAINIFSINRAFIPLYHKRAYPTLNVVTMYHHEKFIEGIINQYENQDFNLIIIQLQDIRFRQLPPGDTANMFIHYLVHKMRSWGAKNKKIYLTGFDYSYEKDWKPQIKSLRYCQVMAEYNNIDIICTSNNQRLNFLHHQPPLPTIYFINQKIKKLTNSKNCTIISYEPKPVHR